jgi:L-ectoine synthase
MIVRSLNEIIGTQRDVSDPEGNWVSRRLLLKEDGMGFSFHETIIFKGTETKIWYKNHLEAVYCVEGEGELETIPQKEIYPINPGTLYAMNKHDQHYLRATGSDLRLVCVFNPPLSGSEVHDEEGSYPPSG